MGARRIVKKPSTKQLKRPLAESWLTRRMLGGVMLISGIGGLLGFSVWQLAQPDTLPIRQVQVKGEFRYLDKQSLYKTIADVANAGFFNVNVDAVKQAAETVAWVDSASVRRIWPDILRIDIREQVPLARWGTDAFVNRRGEVVPVQSTDVLSELPAFSGPEGSAVVLAERYQLMSSMLAKVQLAIVTLTLSERRAWQLSLNNGVQLLLGRATLDAPLSRFIKAYDSVLAKKLENIESVDLRYTNGFSVRWKTAEVS